jgi:hypothetical protein
VLSTEQASESSGEGRSFIVSGVGMENERTLGLRKSRRLLIGQRAKNPGGRDIDNLIAVHETKPVVDLYGDTVENVQLRDLQYVLDGPELILRGTEHGCSQGQSSIRNWPSVIHQHYLPFCDLMQGMRFF